MAIDNETMQTIERCVARALANATSLKGASEEIAKGVTQYVGARYVPLFAEPLEWSSDREYEPLTIVLNQGNSYTSRQFVPKGVELTNESFWANTGNYNAQVEQYRQEVKTFDGRITANDTAIKKEVQDRATAVTAEKTRATAAEQTLQANIDAEKTRATAAEQTLQANIDAEKTRAEDAEAGIKNSMKKNVVLFGDSWCANSPGIGIGQRIYNLLKGDKTLVGNYGSSGAQFGTASMTSTANNTEAELNKSISELSSDVRKSVTHLIMICGTNNIGTAQIDIDTVISHWSAFKSAYPNAKMFMLFSSPRSFFNEHMSGNICSRIYMPLITGCNLSGVTTLKNSLTWLKTQNEDKYWGANETWYANHPNETGRDVYASIAASAIESGVDVETYSLIDFTYGKDVNADNSYVEAFIKGTEITLIGYVTFNDISQLKNKATNVINIPKLCFLSPITYVRSPASGVKVDTKETVEAFWNTNGSAPIQITNGSNVPTAFYTINMRYEIL